MAGGVGMNEIPEAAVTAAAGRLWHRLEGVGRDQCKSIAEEALAAAAPLLLAAERERIVAELQQEAVTHLFTIRRTMRWAVWVVRGRPADDDPAGDCLVRPGDAAARPPCCPVETEAVRRAVAAAVKAERLRIREMAARAQASVYDRATDEWLPLADLIPEEPS